MTLTVGAGMKTEHRSVPWGLKGGDRVLPSELRLRAVTCGVEGVRKCPIGHGAFNARVETGLRVLY